MNKIKISSVSRRDFCFVDTVVQGRKNVSSVFAAVFIECGVAEIIVFVI